MVGYAGFQLCELLLACGEWREALARAERGLDFCASHDQRVLHRALFLLVLGRALLPAGRRDEGLEALAQARSAARQAAEETLAHVLTMSADEYCREGLLRLCDDCLDEARNLVDDAGMDLLRVDIWRIEARLALVRGDMTTAKKRWEKASRGVETTGYKLRAAELEEIRGQFLSTSRSAILGESNAT